MQKKLFQLAGLFAKLGCISFGGPTAHIALMREEVVHKLKWMDDQHFLDLVGATNLIPGPNSTEMALHIGHERAGWKGLIVAGLCFILPAVMITGFFAWLYKSWGHLPKVQPFVYGIKPAIILIILAAIYPLAKKALTTVSAGIIGLGVFLLCLAGFNEIGIMFGAGFLGLALRVVRNNNSLKKAFFPFPFLQVTNTSLASVSNLNLFLAFLKIGSIL